MVKHYTRPALMLAIKRAIDESPHTCTSRADGRAGLLLEQLLGIAGGNHDVADAVGFELKTSISPSTPVTLFHKEPLPRGSTSAMVHRYGWPGTYERNGVALPVTSFRATIYGAWNSQSQPGVQLNISANQQTVDIMHGDERIAYWDSNNLIAAASQKLRNMMLVFARDNGDGTVSFLSASLLENFQPFSFLTSIQDGTIAIEYDARTNPNRLSVRNHGTKFRIKERDLSKIYTHATPILPT
jgi:hypothetical protein